MYPADKHEEYERQPNYSVLVDTRDRQEGHTTYVPQANLEPFRVEVKNPAVLKLFEPGKPQPEEGGWNTYTARGELGKQYPDG
jgi:hemimethylated DNA binding protein